MCVETVAYSKTGKCITCKVDLHRDCIVRHKKGVYEDKKTTIIRNLLGISNPDNERVVAVMTKQQLTRMLFDQDEDDELRYQLFMMFKKISNARENEEQTVFPKAIIHLTQCYFNLRSEDPDADIRRAFGCLMRHVDVVNPDLVPAIPLRAEAEQAKFLIEWMLDVVLGEVKDPEVQPFCPYCRTALAPARKYCASEEPEDSILFEPPKKRGRCGGGGGGGGGSRNIWSDWAEFTPSTFHRGGGASSSSSSSSSSVRR